MPWQFGLYSRRNFQSLFYGAEYHLKQARELYKKIREQKSGGPYNIDQHHWNQEKSEARACFLIVFSALESFVNHVLADYAIRDKKDLPIKLNRRFKKQPISNWRLFDKVYFLPTLCNENYSPPEFYFDKKSKQFLDFDELIKIRNSFVHNKPEDYLQLFKLNLDKNHELIDEFKENIWPITGIYHDLTIFNAKNAEFAYENIIWLRSKLFEKINLLDEKYLKQEEVKLISERLDHNQYTREELMKNYKKYIDKKKL